MSQLEKICSEMSVLRKRINNLKPAQVKITVNQNDQVYTWSGTSPSYVGTGGELNVFTTAGNWVSFTTSSSGV
jgi:hypothetical protein